MIIVAWLIIVFENVEIKIIPFIKLVILWWTQKVIVNDCVNHQSPLPFPNIKGLSNENMGSKTGILPG